MLLRRIVVQNEAKVCLGVDTAYIKGFMAAFQTGSIFR